jgi:hypothetical protein
VQNTFCIIYAKYYVSPSNGENTESFTVSFVYLFSHYHWATAGPKKCDDFDFFSFSILASKPNCAKHFLQKYYVYPGRGANSKSFTVSFVYFLSLSLSYSGSPAKILPLIVFQYWALNPIVQNTFWHYLCKKYLVRSGRAANLVSFTFSFIYFLSLYH